jgi:hypothetical protein
MRAETETREKLVACLLGTLPDADREALAERCLDDDKLFDELLVVEHDLLDRYARGLLNTDERDGFERYLCGLPDVRKRVAVAQALTRAVDAEKSSAASAEVAPIAAASWWASFLTFQPGRQFAIQYAFLGLLILSVCAVMWMVLKGRDLRRENQRLQSEIARMEGDRKSGDDKTASLNQELIEQERHLAELQLEYEREQQGNAQQNEEVARLKALPSPTVSLVLTAALRSPSAPDTLVLTPQTKFVRLTVPTSRKERLIGYRAVLQTAEGAQVRQWESSPLQPSRASKSINLLIASSELLPATYKLTVILNMQDQPEIALDYYFKVIRR